MAKVTRPGLVELLWSGPRGGPPPSSAQSQRAACTWLSVLGASGLGCNSASPGTQGFLHNQQFLTGSRPADSPDFPPDATRGYCTAMPLHWLLVCLHTCPQTTWPLTTGTFTTGALY